MLGKVKIYLLGLGPLRWMLCSGAIVDMLFRPTPGTEAVYEGMAVFPTLLLPALSPILFMLLMLDALMTRVLLNDKEPQEQIRMRRAVWTNLVLGGLMLAVWYPYFAFLMDGG